MFIVQVHLGAFSWRLAK